MTLLLVVLSALLCIALSQVPNPDPKTFWLNQPLDHFRPDDHRTFKERVLVYEGYWKGSGPIFFCAGGEADVRGGYDHNGFMFELGKQVGAFLLFPEHRFYGKSLPAGPVDSYKKDTISKLTIEQAMADYIKVIGWAIEHFSIPVNAPIVAFGGSYPGDLVTYMRVAYPSVIDAGLASSAPLLYHVGMVPGGGFFKIVTADFGLKDKNCPNLVRRAFNEIYQKSVTVVGRKEITDKLRLCDPLLEGEKALRLLTLWIENAFADLGMENYPYPLYGLPGFPMLAACEVMKSDNDLIIALGKTVSIAYNNTHDLKCHNITEEYYPCADITGCGGGVGDPDALSWDYQSCTQLVSNVDTNNVTDMFPPAPYDFPALVKYCEKTWGVTPRPFEIPTKYNYTRASRMIYSNGALDPWWAGGVLPGNCPPTLETHCILIDQAAHHLDLRGNDPKDPEAVRRAREEEKRIILDWLKHISEEKSRRHNL